MSARVFTSTRVTSALTRDGEPMRRMAAAIPTASVLDMRGIVWEIDPVQVASSDAGSDY